MAKAAAGSKADDKRRRLVEAGLGLLEELPYTDITVAAIAERAGMARGLVFYYFTDKDELFRAAVRDFLDRLREWFMTNDVSAVGDARAWLRHEVEIFLDMMSAHPQTMGTIVSQGWTNEPDSHGSTMMDFTSGRVREAFGLSAEDELLDAALHSWSYHCVDLAIRTRTLAPRADRGIVATLLVDQLEATFATLDASKQAG